MQRFFFVAMILILAGSFTVNATPVSESVKMILKVQKQDANSLKVQIANLQKQYTLISISDFNGKQWFAKAVSRENGFAKKLNVAELPAGNYVISIANRSETLARAFAKTADDLAIYESPELPENRKAYAVMTARKGTSGEALITRITTPDPSSVGVQLANLEGTAAKIQLRTLSGSLVKSDAVNGENGYAKSFNLKGINSGQYYFYIQVSKVSAVQFFSIQDGEVTLTDRYVLTHREWNNADLSAK